MAGGEGGTTILTTGSVLQETTNLFHRGGSLNALKMNPPQLLARLGLETDNFLSIKLEKTLNYLFFEMAVWRMMTILTFTY